MKAADSIHVDIDMREFMGWRCGACDRLITSIEDGWVEWLALEDSDGKTILRGVRLVHRQAPSTPKRGQGCRYDLHNEFQNNAGIVEGLALATLAGPDGLMLLLSFVEAGEFLKADILELAKRLHIPRYELTRELFQEAIASNVCTPCLGVGYYLQSEMQAVLTWAAEEQKAD
jgi:hypothetical protein